MKKVLLFILMLIVIVLIGALALQIIALKYNSSVPVDKDLTLVPKDFTTSTTPTSTEPQKPGPNFQLPSRLALEEAESFVKEHKLPPTEAARLYAYVATAYFETLQNSKDTLLALEAAKTITQTSYPPSSTNNNTPTTSTITSPKTTNTNVLSTSSLPATSTPTPVSSSKLNTLSSFQDLVAREKNDGFHTLAWNGKIPKGPGYWKSSGFSPLTPRSGDWQRWLIPENTLFSVAQPPVVTTADNEEISLVKEAVANRTSDQEKIILFWNGGASTESLSGIWQNKLWELFQKQFAQGSASGNLDLKYAYMQKILAQGLADSFMETWKVKFTYWSLRPNMVLSDLETFIPNPRTPSYVSEHATVSRTAAEILGTFFLDDKETVLQLANEAGNSRLWSGVQFNNDNQQGFKLGEQIGKEVVKHIGIFE